MNVRPYTPEDTAAVARLFTETVHSVNAADYSPEQLAAWAPDPPDMEHWHRRLSERIVFVAEEDSEIIGFATFEPDGHLDYIYAHRLFQRQGVASALFRSIEQEALSRGVTRIFTEPALQLAHSLNVSDFGWLLPKGSSTGVFRLLTISWRNFFRRSSKCAAEWMISGPRTWCGITLLIKAWDWSEIVAVGQFLTSGLIAPLRVPRPRFPKS